MDKVFEWTTPEDAVRSEVAFWAKQSIVDRVSAVEALRQATLGIYTDDASRPIGASLSAYCAPIALGS